MNILTGWIKAIYLFLVGDMRILLGTLFALVAAGLLTNFSAVGAGLLLVALLMITLVLSLRAEIRA